MSVTTAFAPLTIQLSPNGAAVAVAAAAGLLFLVGLTLMVVGWQLAGAGTDVSVARSTVLAALGSGLITGAAVGVGVIAVQVWVQDATSEATWRASVSTATTIAGFNPAGHDLTGIDFSGKILLDAELHDADLRGVRFRDTVLTAADLTGADLRGAVLIGAHLARSDLAGANLAGAHLEATDFGRADVRHVASLAGATVSPLTCWPPGFLADPLMQSVHPGVLDEGGGNVSIGRGQEPPCRIVGG
jgi:hypothetical protein